MGILKASILTACIIGVVSSFTDMAAPDGKLKKQLSIILALILILGIFTHFVRGGFKLDLSDSFDLKSTDEYEELNKGFRDMYTEQSEENMQQALEELLKNEGISINSIDIVSTLDEYNSLEIEKVRVYISDITDKQKEKIKEIIGDNLPETEVEFIVEDSSGYKSTDKKDESTDSKTESDKADSYSRDMRDSADTSVGDNT